MRGRIVPCFFLIFLDFEHVAPFRNEGNLKATEGRKLRPNLEFFIACRTKAGMGETSFFVRDLEANHCDTFDEALPGGLGD